MRFTASICALALLQIFQFISAQDVPNCGPGIGSCADGECCSQWGYCGTTPEHCGTGSTSPPSSDETSSTARTRVGNVPYGTVIDSCTSPGKIALTFDDGPSDYTSELLDILSSLKVKATFFVTGFSGRGSITDSTWASLIRRANAEGHQIASHGWAHTQLNAVDLSAQRTELVNNEEALQSVLGFFPTYFRCPYLECDSSNGLPLLNELGYHVIGVNADTKDYLYDSPDLIQTAKDIFSDTVSSNPDSDSYIALAHDIHYQTVVSLTKFMIETARARGYQLVTVGECLGDPKANWYRGASASISNRSPTTFVTSKVPAATTSN